MLRRAVLSLLVLVVASAVAHAEYDGRVIAFVAFNAPLAETLRVTVAGPNQATDPYVTIRPSLSVAGTTIAVLPTFAAPATQTPVAVPITVPADVRAAVRRAADAARAHRASLHFTIIGPDGAASYSLESFVSLVPGRVPTRTTRIAFGSRAAVGGAAQEIVGSLSLPPVAGWTRTSVDGATPTTLTPPSTGECATNVVVQPVAEAVRSPASITAGANRPGDAVAGGSSATRYWRVRASASDELGPNASALGLVRVAPRRFAGVRIFVQFDPACPPSAACDARLVARLTRLVRDFTARVRLVPRP